MKVRKQRVLVGKVVKRQPERETEQQLWKAISKLVTACGGNPVVPKEERRAFMARIGRVLKKTL
jgi:hypothetical protein